MQAVRASYLCDGTDSYRIAFYSMVVLIVPSGVTFLFLRVPEPSTSAAKAAAV